MAILFVEGHRGCPYFDQRLLLLKVVASNPENFANPEQDMLCWKAKLSIACHISWWVMVISFCLLTMPTLYSFLGKFRLSYFYASDTPKGTSKNEKIYIKHLKTNRYRQLWRCFWLCKKSQTQKHAAPVDFPRVFIFFYKFVKIFDT